MTMTGHMCAGRRERVIFVHDPERRRRPGLAYTAHRLTRLEGGRLRIGSRKVPELSAAGFWSAGEKVRDGRRLVAIIDGAMRFRVVEHSKPAAGALAAP